MELGLESTLDEVSGARVAANLTRHPDVVAVDSYMRIGTPGLRCVFCCDCISLDSVLSVERGK